MLADPSQKVVNMRTLALLTMLALSLATYPLVAADDDAQHPDDDQDPVGALVGEQDPDPTIERLLQRIAELEAKVAALTGGDGNEHGGETQQPCPPSGGCVRLPFAVDEIGDDMTGDLNMIDHSLIKFIPEDQQDARGGAPLASTILGPRFFDIQAQTNFTQLVKLHQNATLNATGGAKVFIDHDGNLSFADGSFLNPDTAVLKQNTTFTQNVTVLRNITIQEGGNIIFQNNTGILQAGNFSRIGTSTDDPFIIMANNETAIIIWPGPAQGDAASIVNGHPNNNITTDSIGNFIAGGGSASDPNLINGSWGIILGGSGNTVLGDHGTAGGKDTATMHSHSFAWGDGSGAFATSAPNTFVVNATGGVGINTDSPVSPLTVGGNITPDRDGVYSLGTPANRWHQLYMASEIDFVTELLYTSGGATVMRVDNGGNLTFTGALQGDASGLTGITATSLESDSITGDKIANGTIGHGDIASGAIRAAHMGESCAAGNVLKSDGSGWGCAEDLNSDTAYTAGHGLSLTGTEFAVVPTVIQNRVTGACPAGHFPTVVNQDGSFTCAADQDTTYQAGSGLVLNGTVFVIDASQIQNRVSAACAEGSSIRVINQDGTVTCELDDNTNTDTLAALTCTALQVAKYDDLAEAWVCGNDEDTTYGAGFGLDLAGTTFNVATSDIQRRVGSECPAGSSIRTINQDGTVVCETDTDTTYSTGSGLDMVGTTMFIPSDGVASGHIAPDAVGAVEIANDAVGSFELQGDAVRSDKILDGTIVGADVDGTSVQLRVGSTCAAGSAIRAINADGTVVCETDDTGGDAATLDGLDSTQFVRSDTSDSFTSGVLTLADGTELRVLGALASDLVPKSNDTYMLGNQTHRFSDLWLASTIHYASPLAFESGGHDRLVLHPDGDLVADGALETGHGILVGAGVIDFFDPETGASISFDTTEDRFELSRALRVFASPLGGPALSISGDVDVESGSIASDGDIVAGGDVTVKGGTLHVGTDVATDDDQILFDDGTRKIMWQESADRFLLSSNAFIDGYLQSSNSVGVGTAPTDASKIDAVQNATTVGQSIRGEGVFDTAGYLGVQGGTDFDGVASADWLGDEIGVAGIATDATSPSDNFGVVGHSNGAGVRGEYSGNTVTYGELGTSDGYGLEARGSTAAANFLGDIRVTGTGGTDTDDIFFDDGVNEFLQWNEPLQRFRFTDELEVDGLVMGSNELDQSAGTLRWGGDDVCLETGNCGTPRFPAVNDVRLGFVPTTGTSGPGQMVGADAVDVTPVLEGFAGGVAICYVDGDDSGRHEEGEGLYLHPGDDTCVGNVVEQGDLRLAAAGGFGALTVVRSFHSDAGGALTSSGEAGLADGAGTLGWYDADADGHFTGGDTLFVDLDETGTVTVGDVYATGVNAGIVVTSGDVNLNRGLSGPLALDPITSYWDVNPNGFYDWQDVLYYDVSEG